jgi:hypothetical protein
VSGRALFFAWVCLFAFGSTSPGLGAEIEVPTAEEIEDAIPEGESLTGKEIYERFLENKLHSAVQHQKVVSTDPGGSTQTTRFWVRWKDYREEDDGEGPEGVLAKTLVKFSDPFDMRNTGFLMIMREDRASDQWIYSPSTRKIRRVKLRQTSVMGTDYTFADIAYENIEDADYRRLADEEIDDLEVYVVEAVTKPFVDSQYNRTMVYLDQEHYVPLRARYWDQSDVEIKEMRAPASSLTGESRPQPRDRRSPIQRVPTRAAAVARGLKPGRGAAARGAARGRCSGRWPW